MHPSNNGLPTPLSLDALLEAGDSTEKPVKSFIGHNLGNRTFLLQLPIHEFYGMSEVANDPGRDGETIAQRKLDPIHAQKLAQYILKGLVSAAIERRKIAKKPDSPALVDIMSVLGRQPYMAIQPIVVNIRDCGPSGEGIRGDRMIDAATQETAAFRVFLSQRHVMWVIDGQHRRKAMQIVFEFLDTIRSSRNYPKKSFLPAYSDGRDITADERAAWNECFEVARQYCTMLIEVHLGLGPDEERQLFHDLNRLGKKVDSNLALQFDNSNPVNLFIKERLIGELGVKAAESEAKNWSEDDGTIARKDLVAVNAILLLNKTNINGAVPAMVSDKEDIAYRFWTAVQAIPGFGEEGAKEKTVAAQPVVLKAMAKLMYDFTFSNRRPDDGPDLGERLLAEMTDIDFSHSNPMWRFYELSDEERRLGDLVGLERYLPPVESGNRDLGSFQSGYMRFGAKHNDIHPIIGDMIRWRLGFPIRRSIEAAAA